MAPLKINVFEPFKDVDFQRSYIAFSETSKFKKLGHPVQFPITINTFYQISTTHYPKNIKGS